MSIMLDRYEELARFLRTRRERITPKQVGLPESGRNERQDFAAARLPNLRTWVWIGIHIWNKVVISTYPLKFLNE